MGELVPGIGDEVLLFGSFLTLAAVFYVGILIYKSRGREQNSQPNEQPTNHSNEGDQGDAGRHGDVPTSSRQPEPPQSTTSTLRSRFNPTVNQEHTQSERQPTTEQEETSQPGGEDLISVRLIKSARESMTVRVSPTSSLQQLRRSHFQQESAENRPVNFIFQGRVLSNDSASLDSLGITDGQALHIHIGRPRSHGQNLNANPDDIPDLDLSRLFVPLFGVILGIVWIAMLLYPGIFNLITKIFLFLLSLGFVLITYVTTFS